MVGGRARDFGLIAEDPDSQWLQFHAGAQLVPQAHPVALQLPDGRAVDTSFIV
jgi:hypothetical protein